MASEQYGVGILGNCCTHGEFMTFALGQEPRAKIAACWEDDPRRAAGLSGATGLDLVPSPEALFEDAAIDIIALACSPHDKAAWVEKAVQAGKHIFFNKPMARSGGGELTNLGCYAVDYMIGLWGRPKSIQAKSASYWDVYREAEVENFGQVIADYGDFFAALAGGKQPLETLPSMDVAAALNPGNWHNVLEMQFEHHNITVLPFQDTLIHNGARIPLDEYLDGSTCPTPFQQLLLAIETGQAPDCSAESARLGVEVLMAAYQSAQERAGWWRCLWRAEGTP